MTKTEVTLTLDSDLLAKIDAWRATQKQPPSRATIIESGLQLFLRIETDPDGAMKLLEALRTSRSNTGHIPGSAFPKPPEP